MAMQMQAQIIRGFLKMAPCILFVGKDWPNGPF
jgi:hypothetical protein